MSKQQPQQDQEQDKQKQKQEEEEQYIEEYDRLSPWQVNETDFTELFCYNCQHHYIRKNKPPCNACFVKPTKFTPKQPQQEQEQEQQYKIEVKEQKEEEVFQQKKEECKQEDKK